MGISFSSVFLGEITNILLACTHAFQCTNGSLSAGTPRAARRVSYMVLQYAASMQFTWDKEWELVRVHPFSEADTSAADASAQEALRLVARYLTLSSQWDLHYSINSQLLRAFASMYAGKERKRLAAVQPWPPFPASAYDTMLELTRSAARGVCDSFLRRADALVRNKPPGDALWSLDPTAAPTVRDKDRMHLLRELIPHMHDQLKMLSTRRLARQVLEQVSAQSPTADQATRVCACVHELEVDDEMRTITVRLTGPVPRESPDASLAFDNAQRVISRQLYGAYTRDAPAYSSGRKSARVIAKGIIASVQPILQDAEATRSSSVSAAEED
jgi:hypothetical protein